MPSSSFYKEETPHLSYRDVTALTSDSSGPHARVVYRHYPYISYGPPAEPALPRPTTETGPLVAHYDILRLVASYLDDGKPFMLTNCARILTTGYRVAAPRLYRYAILPEYEFSIVQRRPEILIPRECCSTCGPEDPPVYEYERPPDVNIRLPSIKKFQYSGEAWQKHTSTTLKNIGRHVKVALIKPHHNCGALSHICPIPSVRTLIVDCSYQHSHNANLCPLSLGRCNFVPKDRPYRLVLEQPCLTLLCKSHSPHEVFAANMETLVIRPPVEYGSWDFHCKILELNSSLRPKRVVFMFPSARKLDPMVDLDGSRRDMISVKGPSSQLPGEGGLFSRISDYKEFNLIYHMARLCSQLAGLKDCEFIVVNAEHFALRINNLHTHDSCLEPTSYFYGHRGDNSPKQYAFYGKDYSIWSTRGRIPPDQINDAHEIIARRTDVIKKLLRLWIDEVFRPIYDVARRSDIRQSEFAWEQANGNQSTAGDHYPFPPSVPPNDADVNDALENLHGRIRFLSLHGYHRLEGNMDEMDDPIGYH